MMIRFACTLAILCALAAESSARSVYLIAAGQKSGKLATFRIGDDGSLDPVGTTDVGKSPWWVLIVRR